MTAPSGPTTPSGPANPYRGDVTFTDARGHAHVLRPSFEALVAAEAALGPLIALARRASEDGVTVAALAVLFHHCARAADPVAPEPDGFGALILETGMTAALAAFRALMEQILGGPHPGGERP
ncbi:hypothetical protein EV659_103234 [Rhodothalassium salexigens DSM 2132]|uniref:Tail tube GTA-gp10-like protein n=1 Tax=Rhodothalassium salexigens DSM 2132 TaxID=1188247 RepID=A0A4R2PN42_RHOSA|nr:GTA-gp10 family protein [Rhodothalassium salexigens]MBB4210998.1 hypothetical protein [Rhodothalassium salexigens DSM 2132]MBK1638729.1 hypothetical protein [Rhodothalassium salexigens DSM 2132]TCP36344.1 hypothetical protein EV659_103234 [Rhodothalassium salexigens DSM 2132]